MNYFIELVDYFIIYAALGWVVESCYCSLFAKPKPYWINRGFLFGPVCPIYGFGALFVLLALTPLSHIPWLVFIVSIILTSLLEYVTSYVMEKLFHTRWWDYSTYRFNINGRVCLRNSLMFGVLSMFLVYGLDPLVNDVLDWFSPSVLYTLTLIIMAILATDCVFTVMTLINIRSIIMEIGEDFVLLKEDLHEVASLTSLKLYEKIISDPKYIKIEEDIKPFVEKQMHIMREHINKSFPQRRVVFNMKKINQRLDKHIHIKDKLSRFQPERSDD